MRPRRVVLGLVAFVVVAAVHTATISCWGENYSRQLGPGSLVNSSVPVSVEGLSGAVAIAAGGGDHSCADR